MGVSTNHECSGEVNAARFFPSIVITDSDTLASVSTGLWVGGGVAYGSRVVVGGCGGWWRGVYRGPSVETPASYFVCVVRCVLCVCFVCYRLHPAVYILYVCKRVCLVCLLCCLCAYPSDTITHTTIHICSTSAEPLLIRTDGMELEPCASVYAFYLCLSAYISNTKRYISLRGLLRTPYSPHPPHPAHTPLLQPPTNPPSPPPLRHARPTQCHRAPSRHKRGTRVPPHPIR